MVDIHEFWMVGDNGEKIPHQVDWNIVNSDAGRKILFKRAAESFIIAQIHQYRRITEWGINPRYEEKFLEDIFELLERLPGAATIDPSGREYTDVPKFFFDHHSIERMRKESNSTRLGIYSVWLWKSAIFGKKHDEGLLSGISGMFGIMAGAIFRQ